MIPELFLLKTVYAAMQYSATAAMQYSGSRGKPELCLPWLKTVGDQNSASATVTADIGGTIGGTTTFAQRPRSESEKRSN